MAVALVAAMILALGIIIGCKNEDSDRVKNNAEITKAMLGD